MSAVHGKKFYGYQGFVPTHLVHPPSMKTGESYDFLDNKNKKVGQGQVYSKPICSSSMNFDNEAMASTQFAVVKATDYKRADRRGVAAFHESADPATRSKKFVGETMYNSTFRNFKDEAKPFLALGVNDYKASFAKYANADGELSLKKISNMLGHATNTIRHPNDWITSKFMKNFDANPSGRFTFGELIAEYDSIITAIRADTMKDVVGQPEWLTASKKMPKKVLTSTGMKSAMMIAMEHPDNRKYTDRTGMWSCDNDMLYGTTRDTFHIPGYSGFIPASKRNPVVKEQGEAYHPRPIKNNLRLIYSHDLPGYTGHKPRAARNDIGEKKGGRDPRTTSGSAAVGQDIL